MQSNQESHMGTAVFLVIKSAIGPTLLAFAFVMGECGVLFGMVLLVFAGAMAVLTGVFLLRTADQLHEDTYSDVVTTVLGRWGGVYVNWAIIALGVGSCTAIHRVVIDVIANDFGVEPNVCIMLTCAVATSLSMVQEMRQLAIVNRMSMWLYGSCGLTVLACVAGTVTVSDGITTLLTTVPPVRISGFSKGFSIVATAYNMHQNVFLIRKEFGTSSRASASMVTALKRGFAVCGVAYGAIGISGLLLGGPSVDANVLKVLPAGSPAVALTKLALCICMVTTAPLSIIPAREAVCDLVDRTTSDINLPGAKTNELTGYRKRRQSIGRLGVFVIVGAATLLATYIHELDVVFALIGGLCGVPLSLLLPSLLYMYALGDMKLNPRMSISAAGIVGLAAYMCFTTLYGAFKAQSEVLQGGE